MRPIPFALTPSNLGSGVLISGRTEELPPKLKGKKDRLIAGSFKEGSRPALEASALACELAKQIQEFLNLKRCLNRHFFSRFFSLLVQAGPWFHPFSWMLQMTGTCSDKQGSFV